MKYFWDESKIWIFDEHHPKMWFNIIWIKWCLPLFIPSIPIFHYSITPCGLQKRTATIRVIIPISCRISETIVFLTSKEMRFLSMSGPPGVPPVSMRCLRWKNSIRSLKVKILKSWPSASTYPEQKLWLHFLCRYPLQKRIWCHTSKNRYRQKVLEALRW